jgi:hypothetical protein
MVIGVVRPPSRAEREPEHRRNTIGSLAVPQDDQLPCAVMGRS